jgi:hypothetical protein
MMNLFFLAALTPAAPTAAGPDAAPTPAELRDIVPPQPYFLPASYLWLAAGVIALALAAWIAWKLLRRPAKPPAPLSARQLAAARLLELRRRAPEMDARLFGAEVCDVLRAYIGAHHGLHPERQTSPEFLASIAGSVRFSPEQHNLLADFLTQCDLLKFARLEAALPAKERLLEQAAEFVESGTALPNRPPPLPVPADGGRTLNAI